MNIKWKALEERIVDLSDKVKILKKENSKFRRTLEELSQKLAASEEENKMARKALKDKETVKSKIKAIIENIGRSGI